MVRRELQRKLEVAEHRHAECEEMQRIGDVKRRAVELGMIVSLKCTENNRECPLCLQDIPFGRKLLATSCCGGRHCSKCALNGNSSCPFCRFDNWKEIHKHLRSNANKGMTWAQLILAAHLRDGGNGFEKDRFQAQEWYTKAADKGDIDAMLSLSALWQMGFPEAKPPVPPNQVLADKYIAMAAKNGSAVAQYHMVHESTSHESTMIWYTLSAAQGYREAQYILGAIYKLGRFGAEENAFKSVYWLRKAAIQSWHVAQLLLAIELPRVKARMYDDQSDVVGYSAIPEACFWYNQGTDHVERCTHLSFKWLLVVQCGCCGKTRKETSLRRCSKCKSVGYCSKACQRKHWKMGHKRDCTSVDPCLLALRENSPNK
jgi:MYND finger/Sel1 repeat